MEICDRRMTTDKKRLRCDGLYITYTSLSLIILISLYDGKKKAVGRGGESSLVTWCQLYLFG